MRCSRVSFAPGGKRLASAGYDGTIRLWDPYKGEVREKLQSKSGWIRDLAWSTRGDLLAAARRLDAAEQKRPRVN